MDRDNEGCGCLIMIALIFTIGGGYQRYQMSLARDDSPTSKLDQAIEIDKSDWNVYWKRGLLHMKYGNVYPALADFDKVVELNLTFHPARLAAATIYADLGEFERAISECNHVLGAAPDDGEAYFTRGLIYVKADDQAAAIRDFSECIAVGHRRLESHSHRALALHEAGDDKSAAADWGAAIDLHPRDPSLYLRRGQLHAGLGADSEALRDFNEAIRLQAEFADAYYFRGILWKKSGNAAKADADLDVARKLGARHEARQFHER